MMGDKLSPSGVNIRDFPHRVHIPFCDFKSLPFIPSDLPKDAKFVFIAQSISKWTSL